MNDEQRTIYDDHAETLNAAVKVATSGAADRPRPGQRYRISPHSGVAFLIDRGQTLRTKVSQIRETGRNAQGVRLMNVDDGERVVAIDKAGRAVSYTSTIESPFGSGLMVNGYYLNNELTDFSLVPTRDGLPVANRVEGGKRPRSAMSPTLVYDPAGKLRLAVGAAGGTTIPAQVVKAIIAVIDWKLPAREAIALPVLFAPGDTVFVEKGSSAEGLIAPLTALGHKVQARDASFKANAVEIVGGEPVGAADPRSEGRAVSE